MGKRVDLVGQVFGNLTVIKRSGFSKAFWHCFCNCGREPLIKTKRLRHGSCGIPSEKHIYADTFKSWQAMKERCANPKSIGWQSYGGAGITVCDRWRQRGGFKNFLADLGQRPIGTSLGRKGDIGNYEPGNVAWQTPVEQVAEKTKKRLFKAAASKPTLVDAPDFIPTFAVHPPMN
jgi:hypothetical protein